MMIFAMALVAVSLHEPRDPRDLWPEEVLHCSETIASGEWEKVEDPDAQARGREWLKSVLSIDEYMGKQVQHVQTPHFQISLDIPKMTYRRKVLKTKELSYYFASKLEELFAMFREIASAEEADFSNRTQVYIWARRKDQVKASTKFVGITNDFGCKFMGPAPVYSEFFDRSRMPNLEELTQVVVHNVAHCLLSNVYEGYWVGQEKGGWLDAGIAHYFEIRLFGDVRHYCYREQDTMLEFKKGKWAQYALAQVSKHRDNSLWPGLVKATDQLSPEEHVMSWSIIDFLVEEHPGALKEIIKRAKKKEPLSAIFRAGVKMSTSDAEKKWKEFVLKNYRRRKH